MAETLPSISNVVPMVKAPTSPVSPGDIASPYANLAATLSKMGEVIEKDIAEPFAEEAGRNAVRTGPDGQLVVDKAPIFGPASAAYSRAARFTYLAKQQPVIEDTLTSMRLKYPNDPDGFRAAAGEYVTKLTDNIPDLALRGSVEKMASETASQNFRTSLVQADATNRENALVSLKSRLEAINERGGSLARQGGTDTPEYAQLHADRAAIYDELSKDARFKFPKERVDQELKANRDEDVVEGVVGNVVREFKTKKNAPEAQRALQEAFWGPGSENLSLSVTQRNKGVTEGLRALERTSVEDKVAVDAFKSATTEYVKNLERAPNNFTEGRHNDMEARARELGDYKTLTQLQVARTFVPMWSAIKALPPAEAGRAMAEIAKGVVPALPVRLANREVQSAIEAEAVRQGVPPQLAVAVAAIESRGNPGAISPSGKHRGLFQLSDEEFAAGRGSGAPKGKPEGLVEAGNIDLSKRPTVKNADGSISTVRSMGVNIDGKEVLIPTVSDDGRIMSEKEAIEQYKKTGKHLGKFNSAANSDAYARNLSAAQSAAYGDVFNVDANIGAGIAQLKAKTETFTREFGRAPTATETYLMHQQGEAGARAHIANPDQPAWANMLGTGEGKKKGEAWAKAAIWGNLPQSAKDQFGSVENVTSRDFIGVWQQKVQGIPYEGTPLQAGQTGTSLKNPYVYKMWEDTVKTTREQLGKNATHLADQIIKQATDGNPVPADTIETFVASAVSSGNDHLLTRVRPALEAQDARAQVRAGGPGAIAALDSQITALKASGVDPVQYETLKTLQAGVEKDAQTWKKDPLSIGVATKVIDPVHQIDTGNPAVAANEFAARDAKLKILQGSDRGVGPASVLTENEGETVKTALVQGDPAPATALLAGMATSLSPENFKATMASDPIKDALSGMIRSRDPARMTAGFAALDRYWNMDSWGFKATFGGSTLDHLQAWQGLKDSFTAPEIALRLNQSEDPSIARARVDLKTQAGEEMKSWAPADVAYQIGSGWWGTGRITGATPSVPADLVTQRELVHDFGDTYTALRTYGVEPDKAKELAAKRLKAEWGPSPTAGNQVMKYPPEQYYKPVDGSHGWMSESLHDAISTIKGPQVTVYGSEGATRTNWTVKGLVADSQTQAEIAAGRSPSYRVALDTGTGMTEFLSDPASGRQRWGFNRDAHVAASEKRFTAKSAATTGAIRSGMDTGAAAGGAVLP